MSSVVLFINFALPLKVFYVQSILFQSHKNTSTAPKKVWRNVLWITSLKPGVINNHNHCIKFEALLRLTNFQIHPKTISKNVWIKKQKCWINRERDLGKDDRVILVCLIYKVHLPSPTYLINKFKVLSIDFYPKVLAYPPWQII